MAGDRRLSRPDSALPDWHIPDSSYRPIPIVWFAGALVIQLVALYALFLLLLPLNGLVTIALSALVTGIIGKWTWERGMSGAATGWKIATIAVLLADLVLVIAASWSRI